MKSTKTSKKAVVLTPAQKAWKTIRSKYSEDRISAIYQKAGLAAAATRAAKKAAAEAKKSKRAHKTVKTAKPVAKKAA